MRLWIVDIANNAALLQAGRCGTAFVEPADAAPGTLITAKAEFKWPTDKTIFIILIQFLFEYSNHLRHTFQFIDADHHGNFKSIVAMHHRRARPMTASTLVALALAQTT